MEGWLRREKRRRGVLIRKGKEEADGVVFSPGGDNSHRFQGLLCVTTATAFQTPTTILHIWHASFFSSFQNIKEYTNEIV